MEACHVMSTEAQGALEVCPDLRLRSLAALVDSGAFEVLSLDVFDTLVWRGVPRPADAFLLLSGRFRARGWLTDSTSDASFTHVRRHSEERARLAVASHEVTLEQIWRAVPTGFFQGGTRAEWVAEEMTLERELVRTYPPMVELAIRARERGMKVALVSDTYFSAKDLIEFTGISADLVLASCEQGLSKAAGLHRVLLEQLSVHPSKVLHVGDHPVSDVEAPRRMGIAACPFPKSPEELEDALALELPRTLDGRARIVTEPDHGWSSLRGQVMAQSDDAHEVWGAGVLGPVLTGYSEWVASRAKALDAKSVWCLMREGRLLRGLLAAIAPELPAHECFISRYVALRAAVGSANESDLTAFLRRPTPTSTGRLLAQLGLPTDALKGVDPCTPVSAGQASTMARRLGRDPGLKRRIREVCGEARAGLLAHLDALGADSADGTVLLADLGYTGTIQGALHRMLAEERPRLKLHGVYLVTGGHVEQTQQLGASLEGWLAHNAQPIRISHTFMRSPELVEQAMMADCGTTIGHTSDGSPILEERRVPDDQALAIRAVQSGVLRFARSWAEHRARHGAPSEAFIRTLSQSVIERAIARPSAAELDWFGGWVHDQNLGSEETRTLTEPVGLHRWEEDHLSAHQLASLPASQLYWPCGYAHRRSAPLGAAVAAIYLRTCEPTAFDSSAPTRPIAFYWDSGEGFKADQARVEPLNLASHGRAWKRVAMHVAGASHQRYAFSLGFPGELVRWAGIRVTVIEDGETRRWEYPADALEFSGMERLDSDWWVVRQNPPLVATPTISLKAIDGLVHVDAFVTMASP